MISPSDPLTKPLEVEGHRFPGTWRYMLPREFASLGFPAKRAADCSDCPMVAKGEYLPGLLCCTHFAEIPNFQLGLALGDPSTRDIARDAVKRGCALPPGMEITPAHITFSEEAHEKGLFGRSEELLCQFMEKGSGKCRVYPYRTVVCSTYHCLHDHGEAGSEFWDHVDRFVKQVELSIGQWAMGQAGIDPVEYMGRLDELSADLGSLSSDDRIAWSKGAREVLWGGWFGKEEEFFVSCANIMRENLHRLWETARRTTLLQAAKYERALGDRFAEDVVPARVDDLWRELLDHGIDGV